MSERIHLCDNFARLGKLLGGCEPQLPKAAAGRARWLLALSRDENAPQQDHWLRGSAGSGFWPSGHQRCLCGLACMGRQVLEVCSPSRSCLWKCSWKRSWDGSRIKMLDVTGKQPPRQRPAAQPPAGTTSPGMRWSPHRWGLSRCNWVLDNLIQAPIPIKGWTR